jgi:hypothetical protein
VRRHVNLIRWVVLLSCLCFAGAAHGVSVGIGIGLDPTGLTLVSALAEMPITDLFDLRAEIGIASDRIAGLMLASAAILAHHPFPPVDPFAGLGIGAALTPPPFSTGLVLEAVAGVRIVPFHPVCLFGQLRYLARWSTAGWTLGPVYEAGLQLRF